MRLDEAMEGRFPAPLVASLAWQLPQDCRWRVSYERDAWWTGDRQLMAALVNSLRGLIWGLSDRDGRGPEPEPIGPSWVTGQRSRGMAMPADELMERLSSRRRGA